jgi:uncharacterized protein YutE (UPF0331/DUF86 family)
MFVGWRRGVIRTLADAVATSGLIVAFRNRLIHGYASVSDAVV